ncbi:MAG TPA: DUF998 domain-containing protein [Streptosporangiaceae bacterium]|nr:DUF998 domain-containing protein [Streptosporangiaceae bacterium]
MKLSRLAAFGGIAGPVLFTVAWVVGSLRQAGHSAVEVQLSGLAAEDARDPQIMMAAFVVLGGCLIGFGAALGRVIAPRLAGPWLVMVAGVAAVAAGVFRRDQMLLTGPGFAGESWHNQVHDVVSGVAYGAMLAAPLVLGQRLRDKPGWAGLSRPIQVLALVSAVGLAVFASRVLEPWNGVVQRVAVTLALTAEILLAARMLTLPDRFTSRPPCAAHRRAIAATWRCVQRLRCALCGMLLREPDHCVERVRHGQRLHLQVGRIRRRAGPPPGPAERHRVRPDTHVKPAPQPPRITLTGSLRTVTVLSTGPNDPSARHQDHSATVSHPAPTALQPHGPPTTSS